MGAAGDMLTAALLELLPGDEQEKMLARLNSIGVAGVSVTRSRVLKCGIAGSHMEVSIDGKKEMPDEPAHDHEKSGHEHHHVHMSDIHSIVSNLNLSDKVKEDVTAVYGLIAEAESNAHGTEVSEVHFHEVGMKDAIMDVAAVCMLMEYISPDRVSASPVHVGSGRVKCAHGIMPVPAPATAFLLKGIPAYSTETEGELCTPTGAALLKYFVDDFRPMPVMRTERIGYGMGSKDYPAVNCIRIFLGEEDAEEGDTVTGISCNVDDMTGEEIGFASEMLYEAGAKEVFTVPVGMKKSRPGILLVVLCSPEDRELIIRTVFEYTTTIGVRETEYKRHILKRDEAAKETGFGEIHIKHSEGWGVTREKYEYDDLAKAAREQGLSIREVRDRIQKS